MATNMWQFFIDRGGSFTDIIARAPNGTLSTHKLLSENPELYRDAAVAGIKRVLGLDLDAPIPEGLVECVKIGTTVATNALLERKGERTLLVVNRGFADLLRIGNQARPRLFDLDIRLPVAIYERVVEVDGRVSVDGTELTPLDETQARDSFTAAYNEGIRSCAIALIHAWRYPRQESRLAKLAREAGFEQVSVSHQASPLPGLVARADTTVVDAYLSPILRRYVNQVAAELPNTRIYFMQSNGGLTDAASFQGKDAIVSGPAGGVGGAVRTAALGGFSNVITFDMGGTSTDCALYAGAYERTYDTVLAGVRLRVPTMAINTVAAGGGSILTFDGARFRVGPESAGANPGPAAYRRGGPLTVTDANICLGKIHPAHFPAIFGPSGNEPLDAEIVKAKFRDLTKRIEKETGIAWDIRAVAEGFVRVANAKMANAIKEVSVHKGHDPSRSVLQCFGGAGGQHACNVADELGMNTVMIHPFAGVLSAYGIGLADHTVIKDRAIEIELTPRSLEDLKPIVEDLVQEGTAALMKQGADPNRIQAQRQLNLRYAGTDSSLLTDLLDYDSVISAFTAAHTARFGFATPHRSITIESVVAEVTALGEHLVEPTVAPRTPGGEPQPIDRLAIWTNDAQHDVPVYDRSDLRPTDRILGPALIREAIATTVIEPGWAADISPLNHMILTRTEARAQRIAPGTDRVDPVALELFNNIYMNVAEQMGAVLRNTSLSVNIKERLDFSCAIFDAGGNLVANAPHVPVHLGAMGESVKTVIRLRGGSLKPGDVIALNNPFNGGTHLPDVTVITPVFDEDGRTIRFFVGNRAHHADIGGLTPGSTPPLSKSLDEEGAVIDDFLLLDAGVFREKEFRQILSEARYPARSPDVNVADIKAQIAANQKGCVELARVAQSYGWPVVRDYMSHVMNNAEESVRRVLDRLNDGAFSYTMDDGSPLRVSVKVDRQARSAIVDFTGTGKQSAGNFNAPPSITRAVILYVFRCLVGEDIPLNDGCLKPIRIILPPGTFLSPSPGAAVVAGNTEVSQAVCNALFGALNAIACSQSTMNNFLYGDNSRQYYETICGGAGAGSTFDGAAAVHTHMTNTRITDAETLEMRYPVRLEEFSIRHGSGGAGHHYGGDGVTRRIRFLEPMTAVIVASRRTVAPFGCDGGAQGAVGLQWVDHPNGTRTVLKGTDKIELAPDDIFAIQTPGGGGFGTSH